MREIKNSKGLPIFVEEFLAPNDRKLGAEATRMNLSTYTRRQEWYVFDKNRNCEAVKAKPLSDLDVFRQHNNVVEDQGISNNKYQREPQPTWKNGQGSQCTETDSFMVNGTPQM